MASRKLEELTEDDLSYIEKLLGQEFSKQQDRRSRWRAKNNYDIPMTETRKISKIMDAIRSEKIYKKNISIKW